MNVIYGNNGILQIRVSGSWLSIGCMYSCAFEYTNELILKTDVNAGLNRKRRVRMSDSSVSGQGLVTLTDDTAKASMYFLEEAIRRSEIELRILMTDEAGVQKAISGTFVIERFQVTSKSDDFTEFDMSLMGTGEIAYGDADPDDADLPGDVQFDWWQLSDGQSTVTGAGHFGRSFAGETVLQVRVEGMSQEEVAAGATGREYENDGTTITLGAPVTGDARVYVLWKNV